MDLSNVMDVDLPEANRTWANLWQKKFFEMLDEVRKAHKGIRRLKNGFERMKKRTIWFDASKILPGDNRWVQAIGEFASNDLDGPILIQVKYDPKSKEWIDVTGLPIDPDGSRIIKWAELPYEYSLTRD